jgi:hypothetical protein
MAKESRTTSKMDLGISVTRAQIIRLSLAKGPAPGKSISGSRSAGACPMSISFFAKRSFCDLGTLARCLGDAVCSWTPAHDHVDPADRLFPDLALAHDADTSLTRIRLSESRMEVDITVDNAAIGQTICAALSATWANGESTAPPVSDREGACGADAWNHGP